jgi:UBX domain
MLIAFSSKTRIRIRFADRTMLETEFDSTATLRAIYLFVEESLDDKVKGMPFVLCRRWYPLLDRARSNGELISFVCGG